MVEHGEIGVRQAAALGARDEHDAVGAINTAFAADGYFLGLYSTQLEPDEILTQIRIPIPPAGTGWSYQKLKRKTGDFATAATAVLLQMKGGKVASASIALTNAGPTPLKAKAAEAALG